MKKLTSKKLLNILKGSLKDIDFKQPNGKQIITFIDPYGNEYRDEINGNKIDRYVICKKPVQSAEIKIEFNKELK